MYFSPSCLRWLEGILQERYGLSLKLIFVSNQLLLRMPAAHGAIVFDTLQSDFHLSKSDFPCGKWSSQAEGFVSALDETLPLPGLEQAPVPIVERSGPNMLVHYDILGLTYWMLSRKEEIGRTDLDSHGRFPAVSSHAYLHGYLERPIVDEWLYILGQIVQRVWPGTVIKQHQFSVNVSHDVDSPSLYAFKTWRGISRMMAGSLLKRGRLGEFLQAPFLKLASFRDLASSDPYNTFDWLMDVSDEKNIKSAFYFICGGDSIYDADYQVQDSRIRRLMRRIYERGHEIGLHPSYETYKSNELLRSEAHLLRQICAEDAIEQAGWGGRMHYLRWNVTTLRAWEDAGMTYDSTLGYADKPGFRCGTCFEYQSFDPLAGEALSLRIRPLIAMECTIINSMYLGLGASELAKQKFNALKSACAAVGGCFTLLWHNSSLNEPALRELYTSVADTEFDDRVPDSARS